MKASTNYLALVICFFMMLAVFFYGIPTIHSIQREIFKPRHAIFFMGSTSPVSMLIYVFGLLFIWGYTSYILFLVTDDFKRKKDLFKNREFNKVSTVLMMVLSLMILCMLEYTWVDGQGIGRSYAVSSNIYTYNKVRAVYFQFEQKKDDFGNLQYYPLIKANMKDDSNIILWDDQSFAKIDRIEVISLINKLKFEKVKINVDNINDKQASSLRRYDDGKRQFIAETFKIAGSN